MILPSSLKLEGTTIHILQKPVVYIWMRGEECLYIGASRGGLARAISIRHHVIGVKDHIQSTDQIYLYHVPERDIDRFEIDLMNELKPRYNHRNSVGHYS